MTTSIPSFRAVTLVDGTVTTSTAPVRAVVLSAVALSIVGGGLAWRHRQRAQQPAPQEESGDGDGWFTSGPSKLFDPTSTMGHPRSSQGTGAATDEAQGVSSVPGLRSSRPGPSSSFWTPAIHQRTRALHFVRSMLGQMSGVIFESSDDDGSATDVSLNCKIAVEIEERAREDLIDAIDIFETALEEQEMRTADNPAVSEELAYILTKAAEYLDISNEREKLELRRVALYQERGEDCEEQEVADEWDEIDDDDEGELDGLQGNLFTGPASTSAPLPFASEMDRLLHAAALAGLNAPEEVFEDEWEPEEAEGPRYAARRGRGFASLPPRAASRDESPDSDFRIVAADGRDFADVLKDLRPRRQDPAEESSESMEDFEEGTDDFEERGGVWTVARKVAFEEELMDRINLIALDLGMTSTEGDWKELPLQMSKGDKKHAPPRGRANDRHNTGEDEEWEAASDSEDDAPMEEQPSAAVKPKKRLRLKSSR